MHDDIRYLPARSHRQASYLNLIVDTIGDLRQAAKDVQDSVREITELLDEGKIRQPMTPGGQVCREAGRFAALHERLLTLRRFAPAANVAEADVEAAMAGNVYFLVKD